MVQLYCSTDNWEKNPFYFIREIRFSFDGQCVNSCPCLPSMYVIGLSRWDITAKVYEFFRDLPFNVDMVLSYLKQMNLALYTFT